MPLHRQRKGMLRNLDRLDNAVGRTRGHRENGRYDAARLMVQTVDLRRLRAEKHRQTAARRY